jgi:hypothetical protein
LSRTARKGASSLVYYFQKAYWKLVTLKPSTVLLAALAIAASVFLLGGGIYDILEQPIIAFVGEGGRVILYYPQALNEQLLGESIASMVLYSLGIIGLILMYQSTKYVYSPRNAFTTLLIGLILLLIGWVIVEFYLFPSTMRPFQ